MNPKYIGRFGDSLIYRIGESRIILSGPKEREAIGWHFSISHESRNPTWEEQRDARYALIPDEIYMVMIMPPKKEYANIHEFCFHWFQAQESVDSKLISIHTGAWR